LFAPRLASQGLLPDLRSGINDTRLVSIEAIAFLILQVLNTARNVTVRLTGNTANLIPPCGASVSAPCVPLGL